MGSLEEDYSMSTEEEGLLRAMEINAGIVLPMVMKTAIELDLFEIMAKTPNGQFSSFDLASSLPRQSPETPSLIERILRFLASRSVLTSTVVTDESGNSKKLYGMTPMSYHFVRGEDGTSQASTLLLIYDKVLVDCWYHLKDAVVEGGIPFTKAHGMHAFEYPAKDNRFNQVFNKSMFDNTTIVMKMILKSNHKKWYHLKDAVVEGGIPFNKAHGMHAFEYPAKDNRFNQVFNKSMYDNTTIVMKMILGKYKGFQGLKQLVDVGGGLGANLEIIVSKYPNIKGINFDLPHVVMNALSSPGVKHVGGDMFESVPKGDMIFMKWILHDWGDTYCITLLKNCWAALPESGKVVVVEVVIPENQTTANNDVAKGAIGGDMIMLIANPGGKERTMKEYNVLAKEAGFTSTKIVCRVSMFTLMEFYKNA